MCLCHSTQAKKLIQQFPKSVQIFCNITYFRFNSLDWSVKWWISMDWPVKIVVNVVTFEKKCYNCYMSYFQIKSLDWPVNWWISRDWQLHVICHISISNPRTGQWTGEFLGTGSYMSYVIFPYQIPGLVGEMVNFYGLASENSCYICEKCYICKQKCYICYICLHMYIKC